jgi:hypothetical protein
MPIISDRTTIYCRDGTSETLGSDQARYKAYFNPTEWSLTKPPPPGWTREVPRYRVTRDLQPAAKPRFRFETPFAGGVGTEASWQYGERALKASEEIETREWPHPSFFPLNYSAGKVLDFFNGAMKSRLPRSPWHEGRVRLDDGVSNAPGIVDIRPPRVQPMNLRPVV